jgi:hypothetical protein
MTVVLEQRRLSLATRVGEVFAVEFWMTEKKQKNLQRPDRSLEVEALAALEEARAMPHGPERTEAMRKAGKLRNAADLLGITFAKRGRPAKT